jgi:hypothetical protein
LSVDNRNFDEVLGEGVLSSLRLDEMTQLAIVRYCIDVKFAATRASQCMFFYRFTATIVGLAYDFNVVTVRFIFMAMKMSKRGDQTKY